MKVVPLRPPENPNPEDRELPMLFLGNPMTDSARWQTEGYARIDDYVEGINGVPDLIVTMSARPLAGSETDTGWYSHYQMRAMRAGAVAYWFTDMPDLGAHHTNNFREVFEIVSKGSRFPLIIGANEKLDICERGREYGINVVDSFEEFCVGAVNQVLLKQAPSLSKRIHPFKKL